MSWNWKEWTAASALVFTTSFVMEGCDGDQQREDQPPRGPYFATCDEAERAGAAPMDQDRPGSGYRPELDPDRDGKACEQDEGG